jgi:hypothetical protein
MMSLDEGDVEVDKRRKTCSTMQDRRTVNDGRGIREAKEKSKTIENERKQTTRRGRPKSGDLPFHLELETKKKRQHYYRL